MSKRNNIYKSRRWHKLLGLFACLPLGIVGLSGGLLALKDSIAFLWLPQWCDPWPLVYQIHRSLVAGAAGKLVVSALGLSLSAMLWSGSRARVRGRSIAASRHALVGLTLGIPLAIVGSLGAVLNYSDVLTAWLDPVPTVASLPTAPLAPKGASQNQMNFDLTSAPQAAKVTAARAHDPKDLVKIYSPKANQPYFIFYYRDNTRLYIDPVSFTVLKTRTSWSHWTSALLPLHSLKPLGVVGTFLLLLIAAALMFLSSRGLLKLWQESKKLVCRRHPRDVLGDAI